MMPMLVPRRLGSAAMAIIVSEAAWKTRSYVTAFLCQTMSARPWKVSATSSDRRLTAAVPPVRSCLFLCHKPDPVEGLVHGRIALAATQVTSAVKLGFGVSEQDLDAAIIHVLLQQMHSEAVAHVCDVARFRIPAALVFVAAATSRARAPSQQSTAGNGHGGVDSHRTERSRRWRASCERVNSIRATSDVVEFTRTRQAADVKDPIRM